MEFWATEVKSGETLPVVPGDDMVLHLSQANLGEIKKTKGNENVNLFVNVAGKKLVLGTLSSERLPQQQFDLVFDKEFEISHNWKNGSVYFFGYKAANDFGRDEDEEGDSSESEEDVDIPLDLEISAKPETKVIEEKAVGVKKPGKDSASEKKVNKETANGLPKGEGSEDEDSDDEEDDSISDEATDMDEDDEDDSDNVDDSSEEEEPAKPVPGKKRSSEAAPETPVSKKKAKLITPQKTDGKKGGVHVATPHPAKTGKSSAKSSGGHVCKSCSRSFSTEGALDSHSKAKHSEGK